MKNLSLICLCLLLFINVVAQKTEKGNQQKPAATGFTDAATFGFPPEATGVANTIALQKAVDKTGTIIISQPGTYKLAGTVYVGSNTSIVFGNNVFSIKVDEKACIRM